MENPKDGYSHVFEVDESTCRWNDLEQGRHGRSNHRAGKSQGFDYPVKLIPVGRLGLSFY